MNNTEQRRSLSWFVYFMIMVFVFLAGTFSSSAQIKDIFKYSTFYASGNVGAPLMLTNRFLLTEQQVLVN